MCIYCNTQHYRKIYANHKGPIPTDRDGRSYDIHHIDGNHDNNHPDNLMAVSLMEHYELHKAQGDWAACLLFSERLKLTANQKSELASKSNLDRIAKGTHPFLSGDVQRKANANRLGNGTHNFLTNNPVSKTNSDRIQKGTHHFVGENNPSKQKVKNGTHHFTGGAIVAQQIANGTHTSQIKIECPHCHKTVSANMFGRWHGDKCKLK